MASFQPDAALTETLTSSYVAVGGEAKMTAATLRWYHGNSAKTKHLKEKTHFGQEIYIWAAIFVDAALLLRINFLCTDLIIKETNILSLNTFVFDGCSQIEFHEVGVAEVM